MQIQGPADAPETGTVSSYELFCDERPGEVPTVEMLRATFPYVGTFHFRAKIPAAEGRGEEDFVWLDLTDEVCESAME